MLPVGNGVDKRCYANVLKEPNAQKYTRMKGHVEGEAWLSRSAVSKLWYLAAAGQIQEAFCSAVLGIFKLDRWVG